VAATATARTSLGGRAVPSLGAGRTEGNLVIGTSLAIMLVWRAIVLVGEVVEGELATPLAREGARTVAGETYEAAGPEEAAG